MGGDQAIVEFNQKLVGKFSGWSDRSTCSSLGQSSRASLATTSPLRVDRMIGFVDDVQTDFGL